MYNRNRIGPKMDPCGTLQSTIRMSGNYLGIQIGNVHTSNA